MDGKRPKTNYDALLETNVYDVLLKVNRHLLIDGRECVLDILRSAIPGERDKHYLGGLRFCGESDGMCEVVRDLNGVMAYKKPCEECIERWLHKA